jgi:hypothetical protein
MWAASLGRHGRECSACAPTFAGAQRWAELPRRSRRCRGGSAVSGGRPGSSVRRLATGWLLGSLERRRERDRAPHGVGGYRHGLSVVRMSIGSPIRSVWVDWSARLRFLAARLAVAEVERDPGQRLREAGVKLSIPP